MVKAAPHNIYITFARNPRSSLLAKQLKSYLKTMAQYALIWDGKGIDEGEDLKTYLNKLPRTTVIFFVLDEAFLTSAVCMDGLVSMGTLANLDRKVFALVAHDQLLDEHQFAGTAAHWDAQYAALKSMEGEIAGGLQIGSSFPNLPLKSIAEIALRCETILQRMTSLPYMRASSADELHATEWESFRDQSLPLPPSPKPPKPLPTPRPKYNDKEAAAIIAGVAKEMVLVAGGPFDLGATGDKKRKRSSQVELHDFWIGKYTVTQAQWEAVMEDNPSRFRYHQKCPVDQVDLSRIEYFINYLNELTGLKYRLPREDEWEYAAKGGRKGRGHEFAGSGNIAHVAWYADNSIQFTRPVGRKRANELGLYDMSGNIFEVCKKFEPLDETSIAPNFAGAWSNYGKYVLRGGCYGSDRKECTVTYRQEFYGNASYAIGFRLVREV